MLGKDVKRDLTKFFFKIKNVYACINVYYNYEATQFRNNIGPYF